MIIITIRVPDENLRDPDVWSAIQAATQPGNQKRGVQAVLTHTSTGEEPGKRIAIDVSKT